MGAGQSLPFPSCLQKSSSKGFLARLWLCAFKGCRSALVHPLLLPPPPMFIAYSWSMRVLCFKRSGACRLELARKGVGREKGKLLKCCRQLGGPPPPRPGTTGRETQVIMRSDRGRDVLELDPTEHTLGMWAIKCGKKGHVSFYKPLLYPPPQSSRLCSKLRSARHCSLSSWGRSSSPLLIFILLLCTFSSSARSFGDTGTRTAHRIPKEASPQGPCDIGHQTQSPSICVCFMNETRDWPSSWT